MNSPEVLKEKGQQALQGDDFLTAAACFEALVEQEPEIPQHHLALGLAYLLAGQEEAAQLAWAIAFSEVDENHENELFQELIKLIQTKTQNLEQQGKWELAYLLYQHLHEINPLDVNVILQSIQAAMQGNQFDSNLLICSGLLEALTSHTDQSVSIDSSLMETVLGDVLAWDVEDPEILPWIEKVASYLPDKTKIVYRLNEKAVQLRQRSILHEDFDIALTYAEAGLRLDPKHFGLNHERIMIYIKRRDFKKAASLAEKLFLECQNLRTKIRTKGLLIEGLFHIPERWQEAKEELESLLLLLDSFIQEYEGKSDFQIAPSFLLRNLFYFQYIQDDPKECRVWQNRLSSFYLKTLQNQENTPGATAIASPVFSHQNRQTTQREKLRIGFLSEFMDQHSIGWLSRWIFQHYDASRFEFYAYFQSHELPLNGLSTFSETWFARPATRSFAVYGKPHETAQKIYDDEIDILVDLDSVTSEDTYAVMALKPAPVQVTWLGYDASGLPTVDYFLVDPLVVPDHANEYYAEALWRLPRTYIAVDGFEVGVPSLQRKALNIPSDAVVYFSAQTAIKRHPETVSCQLQILKQVPNSYLLLKGIGDNNSLRNALFQAAEMEGISRDRFRFLELDKDEATHRANLSIADVVLDTFPYTGATTTMETLWMGIPLVTRVGQQFASRNSYAMLRHAGIEAGIAHSAAEYIEWGVRFGTDAGLREQVQAELWRSRQTSPLWNAEQFTRDMESAFEQMWQRYLNSDGKNSMK
ncbi:O-linked N-acetylglucosamine transferase, SPINDLY family protein [Leptolyngbya sp. FACHB-8]|uniref:O-linked N-acetylglucosamine transferase, SPINDLY family protein n=1 Tax=unclassified Leptolyngbya TaxID=2650499 RepID=UPI001689AB71|nr:O-linked N-acetylglucosamine transferase, SPINDLY family protein [Leptolyngbya sp. FACHB-8]MBD1913922.1 O-linked N-acetylglucosamine transferase, SPINDLY family protein [Leptolyngbya sp. FACHB-8]